MRGRRKSVREGRVLLVVPDSEELAQVATGLRSAGWRVGDETSSRAPVVGVLPTPWILGTCPRGCDRK
jgi:hypothetical protein